MPTTSASNTRPLPPVCGCAAGADPLEAGDAASGSPLRWVEAVIEGGQNGGGARGGRFERATAGRRAPAHRRCAAVGALSGAEGTALAARLLQALAPPQPPGASLTGNTLSGTNAGGTTSSFEVRAGLTAPTTGNEGTLLYSGKCGNVSDDEFRHLRSRQDLLPQPARHQH